MSEINNIQVDNEKEFARGFIIMWRPLTYWNIVIIIQKYQEIYGNNVDIKSILHQDLQIILMLRYCINSNSIKTSR